MDVTVTILRDLSIVAMVSGVMALIFHYLKFPLMIGYMLGGFFIGPHFFSNWIGGEASIEQLRELGVIFLMFYIGLEFDLMKLKRIFMVSTFWLVFQVLGMMSLGMMIAPVLGWHGLNGLFLGAMLSVSSTMITVPLLAAKNELNTEHGQCAVGALILEDILAIILLVLLSSVGRTGSFDVEEVKRNVFIVSVFVMMVYFFGKLLAPYFVRALFRSSSSEVLTVAAVGFIMGICMLAEHFHFSPALGAFLAGSILAQTHIAEQLDKQTEPLRDFFNAVFFTSVGMLIDFGAIFHLWQWVLLLVLITFFGKTIIGAIALFLLGKPMTTGVRAASANAQIGEFSFVIAALGNSMGVLNKDFMSVTVGVSIGSILLCVIASKNTDRICHCIENHVPGFLKTFGEGYRNLLKQLRENVSKNEFIRLTIKQMLGAMMWFFLLSGTLAVVSWFAELTQRGHVGAWLNQVIGQIGEIFAVFVKPWFSGTLSDEAIRRIGVGVFQFVLFGSSYLLCLPFLIGVVKSLHGIFAALIQKTFSRRPSNAAAAQRISGFIKLMMVIAGLFLFSGVFLGIAARYMPGGMPIALFGLVILAIALLMWRNLRKMNSRLEVAFVDSFNDRIESQEQENRRLILERAAKNDPWPIKIEEIPIKLCFDVVGKDLAEVNLRAQTGTSVIAITRGGISTYKIGPTAQIFPGDKLIVIGTEKQLEKARMLITKEKQGSASCASSFQFDILNFCIGKDQSFVGHQLSDLGLRRQYGLNVVGIQRSVEKILEIVPTVELKENDILLLAGPRSAIESFQKTFPVGTGA